MLGKGNKLYSIFRMKCPRCHESDLFVNKNPFKIDGFFDMPEKCPTCLQKFEMEPGFYYGAMYVSYAVCIAYLVSVWVALLVLYPSFTLEFYLIAGIGSMVILTPYIFKISRAIWINFFVSYQKPEEKEKF